MLTVLQLGIAWLAGARFDVALGELSKSWAELKASGLIPGFGGQNRTLSNVTSHGEL